MINMVCAKGLLENALINIRLGFLKSKDGKSTDLEGSVHSIPLPSDGSVRSEDEFSLGGDWKAKVTKVPAYDEDSPYEVRIYRE